MLDHAPNQRTHEIIRSGFDRSPIFTGKIEAWAALLPQCGRQDQPLADKDSHQIFLEPEGLTTHEPPPYPNGISTSRRSTSNTPWCAA